MSEPGATGDFVMQPDDPPPEPVRARADLLLRAALAESSAELLGTIAEHLSAFPHVRSAQYWTRVAGTPSFAMSDDDMATEFSPFTLDRSHAAAIIDQLPDDGTILRVPDAQGRVRPAYLLPLTAGGESPTALVVAFLDEHARLNPLLDLPSVQALGRQLRRLQELEALRESEHRYRTMVDQANEIILICDPASGAILDANPHACAVLGLPLPELLSAHMRDVLDGPTPVELPLTAERVQGRHLRRANGDTVEADVLSTPIELHGGNALLILARNAGEQRQFDREQMQAQKMESLGQMAGQVAHEFNNQLASIMGFSGLVRLSPALTKDDLDNLRMLEDAARRAGELTGRLLSFARGNLVQFVPVNVVDALNRAIRTASGNWAEHVALTFSAAAPDILVDGDASQLEDAFFNILENAGEALAERGGTVAVTTGTRSGRAIVTITDTGPGMPHAVRQHIFEPFYSTKPSTAGVGLGLAISYGVVRAHHGSITVESTVGVGTTFSIDLPLALGSSTLPTSQHRARLALVAIADPIRRTQATATVRRDGYIPIEVPSEALAERVVATRPGRFSLCVLESLDNPVLCSTLLRHQPTMRLTTA